MSADADVQHLARALQLAERGLNTADPNPRVGCVLVKDGQVIAEGWHERAGEPHAEAQALRAAGAQAAGCTAYVTLEPCSHTGRTPPCADALIAAGVRRVVAPGPDPNPRVAGMGFARLRAAGVEVGTGLLEREARALNPGFFSRFEHGRPWVRVKLGMSLDGRTALADGRSQWITGEAARADVQRWRARSSAILTGAGTARADDPRLDVRWEYGSRVRQPLRVLLDPSLSVPHAARLFSGGQTLVFSGSDALVPADYPATVVRVPADRPAAGKQHGGAGPAGEQRGRLNLAAVLAALAQREVNELLVEAGARLAGAFVQAGLADELLLYVAPALLGTAARPLLDLAEPPDLPSAARFEYADVRRIGDDLRLLLRARGGDT